MALSRMCSSRVPLIIILGATGTGKTKLSIQLADKYQTEIISADSMQIYKGLDIISAKATPEERATVPHHVVDILHPHQTYTVVDFRNTAVKIIDDMLSRQKIPVVVGGTNYYIESILWKVLVEEMVPSSEFKLLSERDQEMRRNKRMKTDTKTSFETDTLIRGAEVKKTEDVSVTKDETCVAGTDKSEEQVVVWDGEEDFSEDSALDTTYLFAKLKQVDPEMTERLHPNNRRKILRSLQVWASTGKRHSDVLREQREQDGGSGLGGPLRYNNAIIFWLFCQQDIHDTRLVKRVDDMMDEGLVKELTDFHDKYNKQRIMDNEPTDYTKGVFQSIGFKEFHEYLILNEADRQTEQGQKLFKESLENMKIATKRYARRQNKMIKNRFLGHPGRQVPQIYKLDTSDVSKWSENVFDKAITIIEHFQAGNECLIQSEQYATGLNYADGRNPNVSHFCETCQRVFIGDFQYGVHLKSKRHQKVSKKIKNEQEQNEIKIKNEGSSGSSL